MTHLEDTGWRYYQNLDSTTHIWPAAEAWHNLATKTCRCNPSYELNEHGNPVVKHRMLSTPNGERHNQVRR